MADFQIRDVMLADFESIYQFVCGLEEREFDRDALRTLFHACLAAENHIYLIAEASGTAVGYISCHGQILLHHCGWVYEIEELYVVPEYRSQKIGASLVAAVEDRLRHRDCVLLEVASNMRRTEAHAFYERTGFTRTSYKFIKELPPLK